MKELCLLWLHLSFLSVFDFYLFIHSFIRGWLNFLKLCMGVHGMFYYILTILPFLLKHTLVYNEQNKYPHVTDNRLFHTLYFGQENVEGSESVSVHSQVLNIKCFHLSLLCYWQPPSQKYVQISCWFQNESHREQYWIWSSTNLKNCAQK